MKNLKTVKMKWLRLSDNQDGSIKKIQNHNKTYIFKENSREIKYKVYPRNQNNKKLVSNKKIFYIVVNSY